MKLIKAALSLWLFATPAFADGGERIGVLVSSYGDVDNPDEAKDLVINTVGDPDVIGLPRFMSRPIAVAGWQMVSRETLEEYQAIGGGTNFRATSQLQADSVASYLRSKGYMATGYAGFTMTTPGVASALARAQADGINKLVVFYQGAQYSHVSTYIVFREVKKYLAMHPEWQVDVVGVKSFYKDPEFIDLVASNIEQRLNSAEFRSASEICLFLPMHGNVMKWTEKGDPYYYQTLESIAAIRTRFPNLQVEYGFQNHDQFPGIKWTQPKDEATLTNLAQKSCSHVIINGQLTFTVDNLETLYDQAIGERNFLSEKSGGSKTIFVEKMFNNDQRFAEILGNIAIKALNDDGDLEKLN